MFKQPKGCESNQRELLYVVCRSIQRATLEAIPCEGVIRIWAKVKVLICSCAGRSPASPSEQNALPLIDVPWRQLCEEEAELADSESQSRLTLPSCSLLVCLSSSGSPKKYTPGTRVVFAGMKKADERADLIAFIKSGR